MSGQEYGTTKPILVLEPTAEDLAADTRARVAELTDPSAEKIFEHVYTEPHPGVDAQRAWHAAYEASFEGDAS